jgi:acyl-CoA synthetase (AMP-forming)/AMP-acid ligase II
MTASTFVSTYPPVGASEDLTIAQLVSKYNPDNIPYDKVIHTDALLNKSITFGGLRDQAARCAWGLQQKLALSEGQTVLVMVPNSTDFILLAHSVWWSGAVFAPLNPTSLVKDVLHALNLLKPGYIACDVACLTTVYAAVRTYQTRQDLQPRIVLLHGRKDKLPLFPEDIAGQSSSEQIAAYNLNGKRASETTSTICFSSGTTGNMKGVRLSHYNLVSNAFQMRASLPSVLNASHREVFFLPYCHIYGLSCVALLGMWVGSFTYGMAGFDLAVYCQKMEEYKATFAHLVPTIAAQLAASQITTKYDLTALRTLVVAAAPLKRELQTRLKERLGSHVSILQGYGLSECSPTVMYQHEADDHHVGTAGKLVSGTEARLVNPYTNVDVNRGEDGELWIRGPQVMQGYFGDDQATRDTSDDGRWLRTGDILKIDENDNFWVTDRLKELIKYKGFQVPPSELEGLLLGHPDVVEAAVCSIYDEAQATELPLAYVSLANRALMLPPAEKESLLLDIQKWANDQLVSYKKIRAGVLHLQNTPKTATGKILRKDLPVNRQNARTGKI